MEDKETLVSQTRPHRRDEPPVSSLTTQEMEAELRKRRKDHCAQRHEVRADSQTSESATVAPATRRGGWGGNERRRGEKNPSWGRLADSLWESGEMFT